MTGPLGLGLGIAALHRIGRTGARGRGQAIAGVAIGAVLTGVLVVSTVLIVAFLMWADSPSIRDHWSTTSAAAGTVAGV